jgi:mono/diheme cytochrome c family protein
MKPTRALGPGLLVIGLACLAACGAPASDTADLVTPVFRARGLSALEARGQRLFVARCATCHGERGAGYGQNAYNLDPPPPDLGSGSLSDTERHTLISGGSAALERSPLCPPRGRALSGNDVDALTAYLGALVRLKTETPPPPRRGRGRRMRR